MSAPLFYRHCSEGFVAAWKKHPARLLLGPNPSKCCQAMTILVESMPGGYVRQGCSECGKPDEVGWHEFYALNVPMNCPSCCREMTVNTKDARLPGVPGNFVYVCHPCREYVQLADLLPHWSEVFQDAFGGERNVFRRRGQVSDSTYLYCPTCRCLRDTAEAPLPDNGGRGNFQSASHADLQWLERNRVCLTCQTTFPTAELGKDFVSELATLRDKVKLLLGEMREALVSAHAAAEFVNEVVGGLQNTFDMHGPS